MLGAKLKSCGKLYRAIHAQAILHESAWINHSQNTRAQIRKPAVKIENFTAYSVYHHRIDCKITPPTSLMFVRSQSDTEALVSDACLALGARQRNIEIFIFIDEVTLADALCAEVLHNLLKAVRTHIVKLHIHISASLPQKMIAHATAY